MANGIETIGIRTDAIKTDVIATFVTILTRCHSSWYVIIGRHLLVASFTRVCKQTLNM